MGWSLQLLSLWLGVRAMRSRFVTSCPASPTRMHLWKRFKRTYHQGNAQCLLVRGSRPGAEDYRADDLTPVEYHEKLLQAKGSTLELSSRRGSYDLSGCSRIDRI